MKKRTYYFILLIILLLPIFEISIAQDTFFNDAEEVKIQLNTDFVELRSGESFEFKTSVTGLACCGVVYSIDNDEYITLSPDGVITVKEDISDFADKTITLTVESQVVSIRDTATILLSNIPLGNVELTEYQIIYYEENGLSSY